jgi:hypothetical protein
MDSFDTFIGSDIYEKAIELVKNKAQIEISQEYEKVKFIELDSLEKANITINEIENILKSDFEKIIDFIVIKWNLYKDEEDDGGEYPLGEEPDESDKPVLIERHPFYKSFMVGYIVEYYLLKNKPKELLQYIKKIRIPYAKKYEKELKELYNKIIE